ncbi:hypothetical protein C8Q80DRAFT_38215 [Daedaleopsis nitida]|nr:hypothetical protein C8Q80DRAFT_38215 [Daedaleopsis nitida]
MLSSPRRSLPDPIFSDVPRSSRRSSFHAQSIPRSPLAKCRPVSCRISAAFAGYRSRCLFGGVRPTPRVRDPDVFSIRHIYIALARPHSALMAIHRPNARRRSQTTDACARSCRRQARAQARFRVSLACPQLTVPADIVLAELSITGLHGDIADESGPPRSAIAEKRSGAVVRHTRWEGLSTAFTSRVRMEAIDDAHLRLMYPCGSRTRPPNSIGRPSRSLGRAILAQKPPWDLGPPPTRFVHLPTRAGLMNLQAPDSILNSIFPPSRRLPRRPCLPSPPRSSLTALDGYHASATMSPENRARCARQTACGCSGDARTAQHVGGQTLLCSSSEATQARIVPPALAPPDQRYHPVQHHLVMHMPRKVFPAVAALAGSYSQAWHAVDATPRRASSPSARHKTRPSVQQSSPRFSSEACLCPSWLTVLSFSVGSPQLERRLFRDVYPHSHTHRVVLATVHACVPRSSQPWQHPVPTRRRKNSPDVVAGGAEDVRSGVWPSESLLGSSCEHKH